MIWIAALGVFAATFAGGLLITNWIDWEANVGEVEAASISSFATLPEFTLCGNGPRARCVVDGDTFWLDGEKIRIADIDTPEMEGRCAFESRQARAARDRLLILLNAGPFDVQPIGGRDRDQYGRLLRVVTRGGRSIGDQLVSEGLARTWTGRREPWC